MFCSSSGHAHEGEDFQNCNWYLVSYTGHGFIQRCQFDRQAILDPCQFSFTMHKLNVLYNPLWIQNVVNELWAFFFKDSSVSLRQYWVRELVNQLWSGLWDIKLLMKRNVVNQKYYDYHKKTRKITWIFQWFVKLVHQVMKTQTTLELE